MSRAQPYYGRIFVAVVAMFGVTTTLVANAGAQAGSVPGVTDKSVELGYIYSATGAASSDFGQANLGFEARVGRENANGGVNGRKIVTTVVDDQSSGANLTAAQNLVQNQHVFAVVNGSAFAFLTYRFLLDAGVPMVGGGFDGTYYNEKGNENIASAFGNGSPSLELGYDTGARVMKQRGVTKTASVGFGISPSSAAATQSFSQYVAPALGLKAVYTNASVDFGTTDVAPVVLGIKKAEADGVVLFMNPATNYAIVQGLAQNGVATKATVMANGYGQGVLDQPLAKTLTTNTIVTWAYKPVELKDAASKRFQSDLQKYAHYTKVPDYGVYLGYLEADRAIEGLKAAGKNLTRENFISALRPSTGTWDGAGLTCQPIDISAKNFGKSAATNCTYLVSFKNGRWVVLNGGKAVTGKLVGSPAALQANAAA